MALTLAGFGFLAVRDPGNNDLIPKRGNKFEITEDLTTEDILGYPVASIGPLENIETVRQQSIYTLNLESRYVDDGVFPFIFNQQPETLANVTVLQQVSATVPATTPYTVTVTGLTVDQAIEVTLASTTTGNEVLTQQSSGTGLADGFFEVTADTITFNADDAGKRAMISYEETLTSQEVIGGPATLAPYPRLEFHAKTKTNSSSQIWNLWVPNLTVATGVSFATDVDTVANSYRLGSFGNWNLPFMLYRLAA